MGKRRAPGRRSAVGHRQLPVHRVVEVGPDGYHYEVRSVPAARATKTYRCPGCDHEIRSGTAHVVVWPADVGEDAVDERRHWHTPCWANRATRSPTRKWS